MPRSPARLLLSWSSIALLTALFLALQHLAAGPLFRPVENDWVLFEDLQGMKSPTHGSVSADAVGLSAAGTVIGVGGRGWGQWNFAAPGPLPSTIEPFFLPPPGSGSGVYLVTGRDGRVPLIEDLPLHHRAINFQDKVRGLKAFSVRFEGTGAVLSSVRFHQPVDQGISRKGLFLALFCLALILARGLALRETHTAALAVITAAGLILRWTALSNYWNVPLEGDATGYWGLAHTLKLANPFANGTREPVFIWLLWLAKALFGDSDRSARFLSLIFSCSVIPMTWLLGKRLQLGASACLLAAGLAAFNPFSVFMSPQGLQLELFTFLILGFSALWLCGRSGAAGAVGAALILTRLQSAAAVFPLGVIAAWRLRGTTGKAMHYFILPSLALAILLAAAKANTGSYTGNLDHAARYYTAAEVNGDPESGKGAADMTLGRYFFSRDALPRLAIKTLNGYFQILLNPFNPFNRIFLNSHYAKAWNLLLFPFLWLGLWVFFSDAGRRAFLWLPLLFLSALPALQDQYREPRLLFHAAPFFFLLCAAGVQRALSSGLFSSLRRSFFARPLPSPSIKDKI
ncbi:MAG: glycosyltransferase family 39 protein [Elusimicrobiota bacterium]|nr:glycosyltransferase family 39 protein [Elusimicrobiota bacterium]